MYVTLNASQSCRARAQIQHVLYGCTISDSERYVKSALIFTSVYGKGGDCHNTTGTYPSNITDKIFAQMKHIWYTPAHHNTVLFQNFQPNSCTSLSLPQHESSFECLKNVLMGNEGPNQQSLRQKLFCSLPKQQNYSINVIWEISKKSTYFIKYIHMVVILIPHRFLQWLLCALLLTKAKFGRVWLISRTVQ